MSHDPASDPDFDRVLDDLLRGIPTDSGAIEAMVSRLTTDERRILAKFWPAGARVDAPTPDPHGPPVSRLGAYRLHRRIGAGASGAVFDAEDVVLHRQVAVKILAPDVHGTGERAERFDREVRALAKLRHENVVSVFAAGEESGLRYIVMELVSGAALSDLLGTAAASGVKLPFRDVIRWGAEVARALEAAHSAGVLHRDVKPSNVRIADDGRAVLLDFGLARDKDSVTVTESGGFRGSPQYASPEQIGLDGVAVDGRTDVYSLGATLYEALAGAAPFRAPTRERLFNQILSQSAVPLRRVDPSIPRDLETVVHVAIEKEPRRRYATAAALAADLEAVADGRPIRARPPSAAGRVVRWARRQPVKAALAGVLALVVPAVLFLGGFLAANLGTLRRGADAVRADELASVLGDAFFEYGEGDAPSALAAFEAALHIEPTSREALAGRALALLHSGDAVRALASLPESDEAWVAGLRAEAAAASGAAAATTSSRPGARAPRSAVDHFVAGMIELARHHRGRDGTAAASALAHLHRAALESPSPNFLYLSELGHAAWHAGAHGDARRVAEAIAALFPESPERHFAEGRTLLSADRSRAWDLLEKASDPPPRAIQARVMIVARLAESKREKSLDTAIALGLSTLTLDPRRATLHHALGVAHLMRGETDAAIGRFEEAIRLRPTAAGSHSRLAEALVGKKRFADAVVAGRESVRLDPDDGAAWNTLGASELASGDVAAGIRSLERALFLRPGLPETLCNLGRARMRVGRFEEAVAALREGHERGSLDSRWKHPSERWLRHAERLLALERRRDEAERGALAPLTAEERIRIADDVCVPKGEFAGAARHYLAAFGEDPTVRQPEVLLRCAENAAQAGIGLGNDAPGTVERRKLRERALAFLSEVVAECEAIRTRSPSEATRRIEPWIGSRALDVTRAPGDGLPEAERRAWSDMWRRAAAVPR